MKKSDLLLLHGALGEKGQFDSLIPLLESHFTIHTLDFEGHGSTTTNNKNFRFEYFIDNIIKYLDKNNLTCVDIFGYSMGGFVGLYFASKLPHRVRQVFTLATKFNWSPQIADKEIALLDADTIEQKVPQFAGMLKERHKVVGWRTVLKHTRELFTYIGNNKTQTDLDYKKILNPVRLSLGDSDKMVGIEETLEVFRSLPNGQLQVFPSTYHPFEKVCLDMLAAAMISYFTNATFSH